MYLNGKNGKGYNEYISLEKNDYGTMMDVGLLVLEKGDTFEIREPEKESAWLLLEGSVVYGWEQNRKDASRSDTFSCDPWCLHVPCGTRVFLNAVTRAELYVQKTENPLSFVPKLYGPEDIVIQCAGAGGELLGCMRREIKTVFDYETAPYSRMVLGEVLNYPGKWSSYPPHHHPQPEVYFHRFDRPQGFGASFANGEIYVSRHNGLTVIREGFHCQAAAPGYAMCYVWGIRHLDGDPWKKTRIDDKEHEWLWKADANDHIFSETEK